MTDLKQCDGAADEWTICDRNTLSIACNEHIQTVMGQQKIQNLSHDWPNVEPMLWAKDGPMSKHYVGPFKIYNHGPIVRRPMGQWRANVYVLSGCFIFELVVHGAIRN